MYANSRQATKIVSQRKAFYRQIIPESSCARKESVDIDILVTSSNDDRKIMQSIRITSRPSREKGNGTSSASSEEYLNSHFWRTILALFLVWFYVYATPSFSELCGVSVSYVLYFSIQVRLLSHTLASKFITLRSSTSSYYFLIF